jgi:hypothetical protein
MAYTLRLGEIIDGPEKGAAMKAIILGIALIVFVPFKAFGLGEIFKIETRGTEFCGDFDFDEFNPKNNVDLWVEVVSEEELLVSLTSNFAPGTTFPMFGVTYLTSDTSAAFACKATSLRSRP